MRVKVLGSAAGGGAPQWNCGCPNCAGLRSGTLAGRARTQTQLAISPSDGVWFLANASPDLRQQITNHPEFAPPPPVASRGTPIQAVLLTSADVDSVLGLLHLREFQPFRIYSTASVRRILTEENSLFRTLQRSQPPVEWLALPFDRELPIFQPVSRARETALSCKAVPMSGRFPDYVSDSLRRALPENDAVVALQFTQNNKRLFFAPAIPALNDALKNEISQSDVAFLDGTFWTDDELIRIRSTAPTARQMGHLPLSGPVGLLDQLQPIRNVRRLLIHINNTNPALDQETEASRTLRDTGWEIAYDGMELQL